MWFYWIHFKCGRSKSNKTQISTINSISYIFMDLDTLNYIFEDQYNTNCDLVGTLLGLIGMNLYFSSIEVIAKLSSSSQT